MWGRKGKVYILWQVFGKGTYGERSEVVAVYKREKRANKAREKYEADNKLPDRKYEVNAWPLN